MKENNDKENDINYLIRQAYNQNNTEADRERYKEEAIKAISGTYYNDLCKKAWGLINKYKYFLKTQFDRNVLIEPEEIVNDFIINKLYDKDALNNYVNSKYVYKNIIQFLFPVLENYFKDVYNIRNQKQGDWQKKDNLEDNLDINNMIDEDKNEKNMEMEMEMEVEEELEEYQKKPDVLDTKKGEEKPIYSFIDSWHEDEKREKDIEDEEQLEEYQKKLNELSEEHPLEVNLLLALSKKDLINIKPPDEVYSEYKMGKKDKKYFYISKGAYAEIVKEKGWFHYTSILENYADGIEKVALPDGETAFILTKEEMIKKAIEVQKKNIEKLPEGGCHEKEEREFDYIEILEKSGTNLKKVTLSNGKTSFMLTEEGMIKRATDCLKKRWSRFYEKHIKEKL